MDQPERAEGVFIGIIAKAIGANGVDSHTIRFGILLRDCFSITDMKSQRCTGKITKQWRCIHDH
jgi:hypothetical protein